ncbi:MAG: class I SAM-dependent RNA methyltransferase [Lachnospiraceae bacterium]|nr:class I SAM-dependent RNA methyltransferase [Lachnospiraceae bacterium]
MKKGQVCEGIVERVDFPNKGIVRVGEETVIVKNSLPGQKVKLVINKVKSGRAEGRLTEVIQESPLETGETCSLFGVCGGCTYLSLSYNEQLKLKETQVKRLLDGVLSKQDSDYTWEGIKGSPKPYEYRNKMEFSFGDEYKDAPLTLGLHKRGSFYDIASVTDCRIVDADYRLILNTVREYFAVRNISYYHRLRHEGYLRHLLVRKASKTGEILVALVTTSQCPYKAEHKPSDETGIESINSCVDVGGHSLTKGFRDALIELESSGKLEGSFAGILHIINDSQADVVQSDRTDILYGRDYFYEELLGLRFKVSVFSFFQTNSYGAEILYSTARDYVGNLGEGDKVVFDLYSGTGTIAQLMAKVAGKVVGVEIVGEAVEAARQNAADNGLDNCKFIAGDVLKVLAELEDKPDIIILDPPRDGIHPKALSRIIGYGVSKIVYISCKPTSLVRDVEVFIQNGYQVERACAVDQFPWTANVETVVLLGNRKSERT